ncbi:MAG: hypothetical protein JW952_00675 [Candidatus Eisenbacteria bacterium]|nr:hypothetical protein [Candidatus Eisenbacteria bacterium]
MSKRIPLLLAVGASALCLFLAFGCSEKSTWPSPALVLESVPTSLVPRIDGDATDREWLSAPELLIAMSDAEGNGGGSFYVRMKSVYTPYPDTVYFMLQWADSTDDALPDRLVYQGPRWENMDCNVDRSLVNPASWTRLPGEEGKEDMFCILFEITPVSDEQGTFAARGCQLACHNGMRVPARGSATGSFDAWYWMRARTDPVSRCDDMVLDSTGFLGDDGIAPWGSNLRGVGYVPRYIAKGENGGLSPAKFVYDPGPFGQAFTPCDTVNPGSLLNWNDPRDPLVDYVPAYIVRDPTGSRGDVKAKGEWDDGRWQVEIKRAMNTADVLNDVAFDPAKTYTFTIAFMNGSGVLHSGSVPLTLKFRR